MSVEDCVKISRHAAVICRFLSAAAPGTRRLDEIYTKRRAVVDGDGAGSGLSLAGEAKATVRE